MHYATESTKSAKHHKTIIYAVIQSFYQQAVEDVLIGHHFRKKQEFHTPGGHPLKPPLEAFELHLDRIRQFWETQLLGNLPGPDRPFQLLKIHTPMKFNHGELNRWLLLFRQTLETKQDIYGEPHLFHLWKTKIHFFEKKFKTYFFLSKRKI